MFLVLLLQENTHELASTNGHPEHPPCCSSGNCGSPFHTTASGFNRLALLFTSSTPSGVTPPRFQTWILPRCNRISACACNSCSRIAKIAPTQSGRHTAYTSSKYAKSNSFPRNLSCAAARAGCCPCARSIDMRVSPCSPPFGGCVG